MRCDKKLMTHLQERSTNTAASLYLTEIKSSPSYGNYRTDRDKWGYVLIVGYEISDSEIRRNGVRSNRILETRHTGIISYQEYTIIGSIKT